MPFDAYLKLGDIKGEAADQKHKDWIEVRSFSWGASNPVDRTGKGLGAGKGSIGDLQINKRMDAASPKLLEACIKGTHIKSCELVVRKSGGNPLEYLKYTFDEVFVSSVQDGGSTGGDDVPDENLSLAFNKFKMEYKVQGGQGGSTGNVQFGWDLGENKAVA